jgi:hypothetical protein
MNSALIQLAINCEELQISLPKSDLNSGHSNTVHHTIILQMAPKGILQREKILR